MLLEIGRKNKHDTYVFGLSKTLESNYDKILKNVRIYSEKKRCVAEVDILAIGKDYYDIYEVKCSYRIAKARKQLNRIRDILSVSSKVRNTFFYCGEADQLIKIKPKHR